MLAKQVVAIAAIVLILFYLWPNLIHEPAHLAALGLQGSAGTITFDWAHLLAHPYITRTQPVAGIAGGLFFVLMPSIISLMLLCMLTMRKRNGIAATALALYLGLDIILNIWKDSTAISDFRFLTALPYGAAIQWGIIGIVMAMLVRIGLRVVAHGMEDSSHRIDRVLGSGQWRDGLAGSPARHVAGWRGGMVRVAGRARASPAGRGRGVSQDSQGHPGAPVVEGGTE